MIQMDVGIFHGQAMLDDVLNTIIHHFHTKILTIAQYSLKKTLQANLGQMLYEARQYLVIKVCRQLTISGIHLKRSFYYCL